VDPADDEEDQLVAHPLAQRAQQLPIRALAVMAERHGDHGVVGVGRGEGVGRAGHDDAVAPRAALDLAQRGGHRERQRRALGGLDVPLGHPREQARVGARRVVVAVAQAVPELAARVAGEQAQRGRELERVEYRHRARRAGEPHPRRLAHPQGERQALGDPAEGAVGHPRRLDGEHPR
jgi:hypothetical protein